MTKTLASQIEQLELKLLQPDIRQSSEQLDKLLAVDFREFGVSGNCYRKEDILKRLPTVSQMPDYTVHDFSTIELSEDTVLATYRVIETLPNDQTRSSLRSSIWQFQDGRWQMLFHQGTPLGTE